MAQNSNVPLGDHFFRHEYGRLVALLTRQLGGRYLQLAEDVVQSSLSRAWSSWPRTGTPANPSAWLYRTARNLALDQLRREPVGQAALEQWALRAQRTDDGSLPPDLDDHEIGDESLRLLYYCCHPALPPESQVALALKTVSGFGTHEIARALLTHAATIEKRLSRAKDRLRTANLDLLDWDSSDLLARQDTVLATVYLIFNEGYAANVGDALIRRDVCEEAIRLSKWLADHPTTGTSTAQALVALLLLHAARFDSRTDPAGALVLLEDQDRDRWDGALIRQALHYARRAIDGPTLSRYHIELGIAWEHCRSPDFESTNWQRISSLYVLLERYSPTPMVRLNAAIADAFLYGPSHGLQRLLGLSVEDRQKLRPWWDCSMARLHERLGAVQTAVSHWRDALALAVAEPQREFIRRQIARLDAVPN